MKLDLIKNEDGTYNLTLEQLQGLSDGDLKVSDGRLYLNGAKVPAPRKYISLDVFYDSKDLDLPTSELSLEPIIPLAERTMMGVPFAHRDMSAKLLPLLDRLFYSSNGPKGTIDFEQFVHASMIMFNQYRDQIDGFEDDGVSSNWGYGIYVQEKYWGIFRGYAITILKLYINMLDAEGKERYDLSTPIKGMKKD